MEIMIWWSYLIVLSQFCSSEAASLLSSTGLPRNYKLLNTDNQKIPITNAEDNQSSSELILTSNSHLKLIGKSSYTDWGYPNKQLRKVCRIPGYYLKDPWVPIKKRVKLIEKPRRFLKGLRSAMYKKADVEKCHKPQMTDVLEFLECQVRRHMRLELAIPKYPKFSG
ncbi:uncharacterized protein LOC108094880 [Drosophila ficusphila]|uniref:uncharacterized protein LOC108094880 n=1 Tax=Drosophila ficusphila TaxID=30025 RepID=UPI0007E5D921|nr:uncharacterized protein LOC108094880 [Drosophila ficusphila]